ncbi:MAG: tRNA pseudouridine(55) synthase TruB [Oscillatoriales cyanobacterium SM2_1_8]|nr:tRNA pseudouridine(55) synthase TruB [Oscillatoriales cyanobacterium SM2_1_8]
MKDGFLNLAKPAGITSRDAVNQVCRLLQQKKVGHSGTLDPAAVGVLPIAVGQGTRFLRFLPLGKAYRAIVRFGVVTDTDDLAGTVQQEIPCPELTPALLLDLLPQFQGEIQQRPPAYSAIKIAGKRAHALARQGQTVEMPVRSVVITELTLTHWQPGDFPEAHLEVGCGPGTYIRSLARDLGERLGCGATLAFLERTHSNGFDLNQSLPLTEITPDQLLPLDFPLGHWPAVHLGHHTGDRWHQGQKIPAAVLTALPPPGLCRVYDHRDRFLGMGNWLGDYLQPDTVIPRPQSPCSTANTLL